VGLVTGGPPPERPDGGEQWIVWILRIETADPERPHMMITSFSPPAVIAALLAIWAILFAWWWR
jgi:hypothetical protein